MSEDTKKRNYVKYGSVAIVILIVAGIIVYFQVIKNYQLARLGDTVTVDYIGTFQNGTIFDTSMQSVAAQNDILDIQRAYTPLEFKLGEGQLIPGFENSVVGMKVGQTKEVTLPPEDAYGNVRQDLIITINV